MNRKGFISEGRPFFPVGAQVHNSSAYSVEGLNRGFEALKHIHANSVAIPLYWGVVEGQEGIYDFSLVRSIWEEVKARGYKLIFIWFGTWKNGNAKYAPHWVKENPQRFWRVIAQDGSRLNSLSPHCEETKHADMRAFVALTEYLHALDPNKEVLIAIQVQNEPGIMPGAYRDYSETAERAFRSPIPMQLSQFMKDYPNSQISRRWQKNDENTESWISAFDSLAEEAFTAYHISEYVDDIARAGKEKFDILMFTNVWLEQHSWRIPGINYPAGGPVSRTLDIWKWMTPHLDMISPDIYQQTLEGYTEACRDYTREDNALFVPESAPLAEWNSRFLFKALGEYKAIGYFLFGAESILDEEDQVDPSAWPVVGSMQVASALAGGLMRYKQAPTAVIYQDEYSPMQRLEFDHYYALALFTNCHPAGGHNDSDWNWHDQYHKDYRQKQKAEGRRGRGLVIQTSEHEFYVAGDGYRLLFMPKRLITHTLPAHATNEFTLTRSVDYVSVEEGRFDQEGNFHANRNRNGDEVDFGIWVEADTGVVRVRLCP
ncbi:DUF5597 domain-containing protein [Paenibacillus sinopodophylli]|uniref:DUF5597 domain-containing protein n=1 Tax=Paenibacillus sinopodophylli TaxID=1837342 RepID=UPI00110CDC55|nr:DUF5597 domain-containing protein [Paenibacillus sinopodophylli]